MVNFQANQHHYDILANTLRSVTSIVSTPNSTATVFAVPELPVRIRSACNFNEDKENINRMESFGSLKRAPRASVEDFEELYFIDESPSTHQPFRPFSNKYNPEAILDLIASIQSRRMDEQRADPILPGLKDRDEFIAKFREEFKRKQMVSSEEHDVDEKLYDLIMRCQGDRIEEQRSALGDSNNPIEEDIKNIVLKMQAGRIDNQRADLKSPTSKAPSETSSQTAAQS